MEKVDIKGTDECWEWRGYKDHDGYGEFWSGNHKSHAHRASWELLYGDIPEGMSVLHKCNNSGCVNPYHLYLGNQADNMRDRMMAGTAAKLYEGEVWLIRKLLKSGKFSQRFIAKMFKVSQSMISSIKRDPNHSYKRR